MLSAAIQRTILQLCRTQFISDHKIFIIEHQFVVWRIVGAIVIVAIVFQLTNLPKQNFYFRSYNFLRKEYGSSSSFCSSASAWCS